MDWLALAEELARAPALEETPEFYQTALRAQPSPLERGHRIVDAVRADLEKFDTAERQRSADQLRMQEFFLSACARLIYGHAYDMHQMEMSVRTPPGEG